MYDTHTHYKAKISFFFIFYTDGSQDYNDHKLYPILVKYFDNDYGQVITTLFSLKESKASSGEDIYKIMDEELGKYQLAWGNVISFGAVIMAMTC